MFGFGDSKMIEIWIFVGLGVMVLLLLMSLLARLYRKAGPHEALIVYGFRGKRVITGHGTVVLPMWRRSRTFIRVRAWRWRLRHLRRSR